MNELGDTSAEEHQKLIQQLEEKKFNKVFLIGSHFAKLNVAESFQKIDKIEDISYHELTDSFSGSFVLVKGSRTNKLENVLNIF